jgi:5-methylcytosine-specific restriction enzyme subunit McrC
VTVDLTMDEVRALRASDAGLTILAGDVAGRYEIEASQIVGTVVTPTVRVFVEPKVPVASLLFLLGYLGELPEFTPETGLAEQDDLFGVMAALYLNALEPALRHGLVQEYLEVEDALPMARGRIDWFAQSTRRFDLLPPVECRFSDLTVDTELNRRLLAATTRIARAGLGAASTRCAELLQRFTGVSPVPFPRRRLAPLGATRRTVRFQPALVLAELILRNASVELLPGESSCAGLLVDMDDLFERFVLGTLGEAFDGAGWRFVPHPPGLFLDTDDAVPINPDAIAEGPRGTVVIDAKYKRSTSNADIYQMLAYCTAVGAARGFLIYAQAANESFVVRSAGTEINVLVLDLDQDIDAIKRRVSAIKDTITSVPLHAIA